MWFIWKSNEAYGAIGEKNTVPTVTVEVYRSWRIDSATLGFGFAHIRVQYFSIQHIPILVLNLTSLSVALKCVLMKNQWSPPTNNNTCFRNTVERMSLIGNAWSVTQIVYLMTFCVHWKSRIWNHPITIILNKLKPCYGKLCGITYAKCYAWKGVFNLTSCLLKSNIQNLFPRNLQENGSVLFS